MLRAATTTKKQPGSLQCIISLQHLDGLTLRAYAFLLMLPPRNLHTHTHYMLVVGVTRDSLSLSSLCYCSFASAAAKACARALRAGCLGGNVISFCSACGFFFCFSCVYVSVSAGGINANLIHHPSPRWLWCATKLWRCDLLLQGCKPSVFFVRCLCVCVCVGKTH